MKKKYLLIAYLILIVLVRVDSQVLPSVLDKNNQKIKEIAQKVDEAGWVFFKKEKKLVSDDIFVKYKEAFGLGKYDVMKKVKSKTDDLGMKHFTYQQYYKDLKVEYFTFLIHEKEGIAELANGELLENINLDVTPTLNAEEALMIALKNFQSKKWAWEDNNWEAEKQNDKENPTWKPKGELMIIMPQNKKSVTGILAYKFELFSIEPYFHYAIYINAKTGVTEKKVSLLQNAIGTVNTLYNDTKTVLTYYRGIPNFDYILKDETRGYICTKNLNNTTWNWRAHIDNHENLWHNPGTEINGATSQWLAEMTYDFYHENYDRHGIDNNNVDIRIHLDPSYDNAGWAPGGGGYDDIIIGQLGSYFLAAPDVIGHEYTHGVIASESGLIYEKEPGALNESFADIFGTMVERSIEGSDFDWTLGENVFDNDYFRSMINPHNKFDPSTYLTDMFWRDTENCIPNGDPYDPNYNDYCFVHSNSGVQNHWFYLLSQAIGIDKAARIAYYNMVYYLSSQSGYQAARDGSIAAATYLYGTCSNEWLEVQNAWAQVGVGNPGVPCSPLNVSSIYVSPYPSCGAYCNFSVDVSGGNGPISYQWYFNDVLISTYPSSSYYFPMDYSGAYYVVLHVTDGSQNVERYDYYYINCDGYSQASLNNISISVYPNPVTELTTVEIDGSDDSPQDFNKNEYTITLVNSRGQSIFESKTNSKKIDLNMQSYQKGSYLIIVTNGKYRGTSRVIKE